jgi:hypothetical protein
MDDKVYQMIAKNIELPKIVIERQGKVRENSNGFLVGVFEQSLQSIPRKNFDLDIRVTNDIGPIIKLEGNIERIGISHQSYSNHQPNRDKMTKG